MADDIDLRENVESMGDMLDAGIEVNEAPQLEDISLEEAHAMAEAEAPKQEKPDAQEPPKKTPQEKPKKDEPLKEEPKKLPTPEELTFDGYMFLSMEDVEKAKLDRKKIDILGQKVRSTKVSDLEAVYEKAISSKIFSTPIGWEYLAKLRDKLIAAGVSENDLTPIPISVKFTNVALPDEYHPRQYITPPPKKKKRDVKTSIILLSAFNLILIGLIVAMFIIVNTAETDNMINYKQNVTNRYAEWEQSLKEREKVVRQKERELDIEDNTEYDFETGE